MTLDGKINGATRYGIVGAKSSVLARASFEETKKHLTNAAVRGKIDKLNSDAIVAMLSNWKKEKEGHEKYFRFKHTARKVLRMLRQLYEIGFASFS